MRRSSQPTEKDEKPTEESIPLPLIFSRSALFTASRNEISLAFNKKQVFASGPWSVYYTGFLLRQQDLDVWSTCLRLVRKYRIAPGDRLVISRSQLLKEMGITRSGREANDLVAKLERLRAAMLTVEGPVSVTRANLLAVFNEENVDNVSTRDRIEIAFDPLFEPLLQNHIAENDVPTTLRLKQVLAKWLYRYTKTCAGEFRVGVEKIREWSGNGEDFEYYDHATKKTVLKKAMPLSDFRRALSNAIHEIKEIMPEDYSELSLDRNAGENGEGQLVVRLTGRPKVLIKKDKKPPTTPTRGQNRGGVVL